MVSSLINEEQTQVCCLLEFSFVAKETATDSPFFPFSSSSSFPGRFVMEICCKTATCG
jgi:hypothetical protein